MPTYRLTIEYDGTDWHGWQTQPDCPTVQRVIEDALHTVLHDVVPVVGSGRTDAGVHARGQIAHMQVADPVECNQLLKSLNGILPDSVVIKALDPAEESFHARYDARLRSYNYYVTVFPSALFRRFQWFVRPMPDFDRMNDAACALLGTHDFSAFCKTASTTANRKCNVHTAQWIPGTPWPVVESHEPFPESSTWVFQIEADRFLHGMVRAIVGTLMEVGHGKRRVESLTRLVDVTDRREAGFAAPACGLILEKVQY